jgi:hypothetical protein
MAVSNRWIFGEKWTGWREENVNIEAELVYSVTFCLDRSLLFNDALDIQSDLYIGTIQLTL